jgi:hypothetical protein
VKHRSMNCIGFISPLEKTSFIRGNYSQIVGDAAMDGKRAGVGW